MIELKAVIATAIVIGLVCGIIKGVLSFRQAMKIKDAVESKDDIGIC